MHARVWQFEVRDGDVDAFVAAYAAGGDWDRLFSRAAGYLGTELYRDVAHPRRFVTVDLWASEDDWATFAREWSAPYQELDAALAPLSVLQRDLTR